MSSRGERKTPGERGDNECGLPVDHFVETLTHGYGWSHYLHPPAIAPAAFHAGTVKKQGERPLQVVAGDRPDDPGAFVQGLSAQPGLVVGEEREKAAAP